VHLQEREEAMQHWMDKNNVIQTGAFHHGMHCHLKAVEH
jgi:hypothetical protein